MCLIEQRPIGRYRLTDERAEPFQYDAAVDPGEKRHVHYVIAEGEFDGYRMLGLRWMGAGEEAE